MAIKKKNNVIKLKTARRGIVIDSENKMIVSSNSGYVSNLLLLFGGIILLCYFCIEGAIYLVK